jgi:restriction endonuclease Mrr
MGEERPFADQYEYELALLYLLYKLPDGQGKTREVCRLFEEEYKHRIPQKDYALRPSNGDPVWENNVRWCRNYLKQRGFLDGSKRGIWRITEDGRRWVEDHPNATRIPGTPPREKHSGSRTRSSDSSSSRRATTQASHDISLETIRQIRQLLPEEQFRQTLGSLYDQLVAEERAKAITKITQTELGRRARAYLDQIHAFLRGENPLRPKSEVICRWIAFCCELELHREAASLLPYVLEDELDTDLYRRTKRLAEASRAKLGW